MSILNDMEISDLCRGCDKPMIEPFLEKLVRRNQLDTPIMSAGLSSYGYDIRVRRDMKVFSNIHSGVIDPKRPSPKNMVDVEAMEDPQTGEAFITLPPHSYALAWTIEHFNMPRDVTGVCVGKSTYARNGLIVNVTPLEAGWSGNLVVEFANTTSLPARVYAEEGIAQILFFKGNSCAVTYGDRSGKYQNQTGLTLGKI